MPRASSLRTVPAVLPLALALLAAAAPPVGAEGLPVLQPGLPSLPLNDCGTYADAGNAYESASWIPADGGFCEAYVAPVLDEQDWYRFYLSPGTSVDVFAFAPFADVDICAFGPADNATPLACSDEPLFVGDALSFTADTWGEYRLQVDLVAGGGMYQLLVSAWAPPPRDRPDVAMLDLAVAKPILVTDAGPTPVTNPLGDWRFTVTLANAGPGWACPQVAFAITGEQWTRPVQVAGYPLGAFQMSDYVALDNVGCLAPGETRTESTDWRPPLTLVGDIEIHAWSFTPYDLSWGNDDQVHRDFVLVGGL